MRPEDGGGSSTDASSRADHNALKTLLPRLAGGVPGFPRSSDGGGDALGADRCSAPFCRSRRREIGRGGDDRHRRRTSQAARISIRRSRSGCSSLAFVVLCLGLSTVCAWIVLYPSDWVLPIAPAVDSTQHRRSRQSVQPAFRAIAWSSRQADARPAGAFAVAALAGIMLVLVGVVALRAGGRSSRPLRRRHPAYLLIAGYWRQSMNTLALVLLAVPISVVIGLCGLGVLADRVPRLRRRRSKRRSTRCRPCRPLPI